MPIDRIKFKPITRDQREQAGEVRPTRDGVVVEGTAEPGATVRIENRSVAPFAAQDEPSSFTEAKAGPDGHFSAQVASGTEGDWVRLTTTGGRASPLDVRIAGVAQTDGRRAEVAQQTLRLVPTSPGEVAVTSVGRSQQLSEPNVQVVFENQRTGDRVDVKLSANGELPAGLTLKAEPGDTVALYATDGFHDKDLDDPWALLSVAKGDEPLLHDDVHRTGELTGPLFVNGPSWTDPLQGRIGDCYLVAAASTIAEMDPDNLTRRIVDKADGTVDVTFDRWSADDGAYVAETVNVSRTVAVDGRDLYYGRSDGPRGLDRVEAWWPMLEKAYAKWKGGYPAASSGYPYEIFEALLGRQGRHFDPTHLAPQALARVLERALKEHAPMVAWTSPDSMDLPFAGTGLVGDHAYSVHGFRKGANGEEVLLRNPWGHKEWGHDGKDDGQFWLPLDVFRERFCGLGVAFAD